MLLQVCESAGDTIEEYLQSKQLVDVCILILVPHFV